MTLATLPADRCAECGGPMADRSWDQPPLIRGGGYGATLRTHIRQCPTCGWTSSTSIGDTRPGACPSCAGAGIVARNLDLSGIAVPVPCWCALGDDA